jgi:hypothetical protein
MGNFWVPMTRVLSPPQHPPDTRKISFRIIEAPELPRNLLLPHGDGPYQTEPEIVTTLEDSKRILDICHHHPPLTHRSPTLVELLGFEIRGRYDNSRLRPFNFTLNGYSVERSSTLEAFEGEAKPKKRCHINFTRVQNLRLRI